MPRTSPCRRRGPTARAGRRCLRRRPDGLVRHSNLRRALSALPLRNAADSAMVSELSPADGVFPDPAGVTHERCSGAEPALGEFLRARRAVLTPAQAGIVTYGERRVPGLRREELAELAGVSVPYLTRLEQGRDRHPSPQVLAALAASLRLDAAETRYLQRLAEPPPPSQPQQQPRPQPRHPGHPRQPRRPPGARAQPLPRRPRGYPAGHRPVPGLRCGSEHPALYLPRPQLKERLHQLVRSRGGSRPDAARRRPPRDPRRSPAVFGPRTDRRQPGIRRAMGTARGPREDDRRETLPPPPGRRNRPHLYHSRHQRLRPADPLGIPGCTRQPVTAGIATTARSPAPARRDAR